jgi:hypothetical protein
MQRRLMLPLVLVVGLALAAPAATSPTKQGPPTGSDRKTLQRYAADTWRSFLMLVNPATGLPSDNVSAEGVRARYTSPTNIGTYIWSTLAARDLQLITPAEARTRIAQTLATVATLERHEASGQFYNWYDPDTGQKLTTWPVDGSPVYPFLSSVDNGWLGASLIMVRNAIPELAAPAGTIFETMDFGFYYDPDAGLLRGGFWDEPPPGCSVQDNYRDRGPDVHYTCHHYGALNTEPRIASYIAIAYNGVPATHYFKMWRTFPDTCDWSWQEMKPEGVTRTYLGVEVFEGHYGYRGLNLVPSWGGSMFEALMVPLLVPEEEWAPRSWGVNHPLYVEAQIEHGLNEAEYGYWGFSPSNNPDGGYREYGVDPIGLEPNGYASDQERTFVDYGFEGCREGAPEPTEYGRGVVTPHAAFLALDFDRRAALANLANLERDFDVYGAGGFYDAVDVVTGTVSRYHLALDQGMVMAALANELRNDRLQAYFTQGAVRSAIAPLIGMEEFTAGRD